MTCFVSWKSIQCGSFASTAGGQRNCTGAAFGSFEKLLLCNFSNPACGGTEPKEAPHAVTGEDAVKKIPVRLQPVAISAGTGAGKSCDFQKLCLTSTGLPAGRQAQCDKEMAIKKIPPKLLRGIVNCIHSFNLMNPINLKPWTINYLIPYLYLYFSNNCFCLLSKLTIRPCINA